MSNYRLEPDANGDMTLWNGATAVARQGDVPPLVWEIVEAWPLTRVCPLCAGPVLSDGMDAWCLADCFGDSS